MNTKMVKRISDLLVSFLLIPLFFIASGIVYAASYTDINWTLSLVLFIFILINRLLENRLKEQRNWNFKSPTIIFEVLNIGMIGYFFYNYSFFLGVSLLIYSIFIHIQYIFKAYQLDYLAILLLTFFKIFLLNGVSFYLNTNFIPILLFLLLTPLLLPFLLSEYIRWGKQNYTLIFFLLLSSYFIGIVSLLMGVGLWSFILLLSLPAAYYFWKDLKYKKAQFFFIIYSTIYLIILLIYINNV